MLKVVENRQETWSEYAGPYPMAYRRRIAWGDCDPAGIIYTPRVLDIAMETLERWYVDVLNAPWYELNHDMKMGSPTVRCEIDFIAAPKPDEEIASSIEVEAVGNSSATYVVTGRDGDGHPYFRCKIVSCFIKRPEFTAAPIPNDIRKRMEIYRDACGEV